MLDQQVAIDSFFVLFCSFLLFFIILGISLFYLGLTQRRSSFTMLAAPVLFSAVITFDWYIWGYSLCYSSSNNGFIGNLKFAVLKNLSGEDEVYPSARGGSLAIVHVIFNGLIKVVTVSLTFPACGAERARLLPMILFVFLWSTVVYNPITYWFWNPRGWLSVQRKKIPVLDFAGGNCVHIVSGFTALAYSFYIGPRNPKILSNYRNSNNSYIVIGLACILVGWCGFMAGCHYGLSFDSIYIFEATILSAFTAGIVWAVIDYYYSGTPLEGEAEQRPLDIELQNLNNLDTISTTVSPGNGQAPLEKRSLSVVFFCSGIMCGLVAFTPAGGYATSEQTLWKSVVCGVVGAVTGNFATRIKYFLKIDDAHDVFAVHGMCGIVGSLLIGILADSSEESKGGWIKGNWIQLAEQLLGVLVSAAYSFVVSLILLYLVDMIPGLHLRIDKDFNRRIQSERSGSTDSETFDMRYEQLEILGSDAYEFNGEYSSDYMEFIRAIDPNDFTGEMEVSVGQEAPHQLLQRYSESQLRK